MPENITTVLNLPDADNRVYILQGEGSDRDRKVSLVPIGIDFSTGG